MKWLARALDQRRMIISIVILLSISGLAAWMVSQCGRWELR